MKSDKEFTDEAVREVEFANRGTVWPRFNIQDFINRRHGIRSESITGVFDQISAWSEDMATLLLDVSYVHRPADHIAFVAGHIGLPPAVYAGQS